MITHSIGGIVGGSESEGSRDDSATVDVLAG